MLIIVEERTLVVRDNTFESDAEAARSRRLNTDCASPTFIHTGRLNKSTSLFT